MSLSGLTIGLSSAPYRAALCVLASYLKHCRNHIDTLKYCVAFCKSANQAIQNGDLISILYGSYGMAVYGFVSSEDTATTDISLMPFLQFCRIARALACTRLSNQELEALIVLWQAVIEMAWSLYINTVHAFDGSSDLVRMCRGLREVIELSSWLPSSSVDSDDIESIFRRVDCLEAYARVHFAIFLHVVNRDKGVVNIEYAQFLKQQVISTLEKIIELIRYIPNVCRVVDRALDIDRHLNLNLAGPFEPLSFFQFPALVPSIAPYPSPKEIETALLFCYADLVKMMIESDVEGSNPFLTSRTYSALGLCRILHSCRVSGISIRRRKEQSLIWAWIVLSRTNYINRTLFQICRLRF